MIIKMILANYDFKELYSNTWSTYMDSNKYLERFTFDDGS